MKKQDDFIEENHTLFLREFDKMLYLCSKIQNINRQQDCTSYIIGS